MLRRPLGVSLPSAVYLGWFGPISVAAIFYLTLEAERVSVDPALLAAGALVVAVSTVAHGVTSAPGRVLYRRWEVRAAGASTGTAQPRRR